MSQKSNKIFYIIELSIFVVFFSIVIILFGEAIIDSNKTQKEKVIQELLFTTGSVLVQHIQQDITVIKNATETLHSFLISNDYDIGEFKLWADSILNSRSPIECLQIAPNGIITEIYPLNDHREAIGFDLLKDERSDDGALEAIFSRSIIFIGPIKLIQNGKYAVIARKPVYKDDVFWGFTISLLYIENLFSDDLKNLEKQSIMMKLIGYSPDSMEQPVLLKTQNYIQENEIKMSVDVPNGQWTLYLSYYDKTLLNETLFRIGAHSFAFIVSILIILQQLHIRKKRLQIIKLNKELKKLSLYDSLTGIRNRRSGLHILENLIDQSYRYDDDLCLAIIDVDNFKSINDTYGHTTGDKALIFITREIEEITRKSDILLRYGGDEFCIIFPRTNLEEAKVTCNKICETIKVNKMIYKDATISLSISIGIGFYSKNDKLTELIERADRALYKTKKDKKGSFSV